jgi:flavin reductase (DIM6/NTAB) family NADH-FMN oxidoreductase RutF
MSDISEILRLLDREIWLVTSTCADQRAGLIATFVNDASIVPAMPRMVVGIAKQHKTWHVIEASKALTLHLLDEACIDLVWQFGLRSGYDIDKFANIEGTQIPGVLAWLECRVEDTLDTGDRSLYLVEAITGKRLKATAPLTMRRVLELASVEQVNALRAGLARDADIDAQAIRDWRNRHAARESGDDTRLR